MIGDQENSLTGRLHPLLRLIVSPAVVLWGAEAHQGFSRRCSQLVRLRMAIERSSARRTSVIGRFLGFWTVFQHVAAQLLHSTQTSAFAGLLTCDGRVTDKSAEQSQVYEKRYCNRLMRCQYALNNI